MTRLSYVQINLHDGDRDLTNKYGYVYGIPGLDMAVVGFQRSGSPISTCSCPLVRQFHTLVYLLHSCYQNQYS